MGAALVESCVFLTPYKVFCTQVSCLHAFHIDIGANWPAYAMYWLPHIHTNCNSHFPTQRNRRPAAACSKQGPPPKSCFYSRAHRLECSCSVRHCAAPGILERQVQHFVYSCVCSWSRPCQRTAMKGVCVCCTVAAISFVLFGFVNIISGVVELSHAQPHDGGITTTGNVTGLDTETSTGTSKNGEGYSRSTHYPLVTFETDSGETVEFRDSCGSSDRPPVGSAVRVSYEPSNPKDAKNLDGYCIESGWRSIVFGVVHILVPGGCVMVVCYLWRLPRSPRGAHDPPRSAAPVRDSSRFASRFTAVVRGAGQPASRAAAQASSVCAGWST